MQAAQHGRDAAGVSGFLSRLIRGRDEAGRLLNEAERPAEVWSSVRAADGPERAAKEEIDEILDRLLPGGFTSDRRELDPV